MKGEENQDKVWTWWEQGLSPREKLKLVSTGSGLHSSFGKELFRNWIKSFDSFVDVHNALRLFYSSSTSLHPPSLSTLRLPTCPFRDSWHLLLMCDSFSLTRTIPETTGLGLTMEPDGATSGCQLTPPLSDSTSKKQFCSKGQGALSPSSTMSACVCLRTSPFLCGSSADF